MSSKHFLLVSYRILKFDKSSFCTRESLLELLLLSEITKVNMMLQRKKLMRGQNELQQLLEGGENTREEVQTNLLHLNSQRQFLTQKNETIDLVTLALW